MTRYPLEFKESIIRKMMPPNAVPVPELCRETGVSDVTLYKWRNDYRNKGVAVPGKKTNPEKWNAQDKLSVVTETAAFNETELSEYCRKKGLYPEQVQRWKEAAMTGYQRDEQLQQQQNSSRKDDKRKIKKLESELRRKDKALAETAALLVLSKKSRAIWGEPEDD
jgi:transposase